MNEHYRNLPLTTRSARAETAIADFADEFLSHGANCKVIFDALAADPECALAQAYAAALYLTMMTRDGLTQAAPHLEMAHLLSSGATDRERRTTAAVTAWSSGEEGRAIRQFRDIVQIWPHDLVAAKFCQILELGNGDTSGMLRTSAMAASVDGRDSFALGLHAFALDQNDQPELALRFARQAISCSPAHDPWAQHAGAHAFAALGQPIEGRAFLGAHARDWDRCSSFMLTHNWWHLALFALDLGDGQSALRLFDDHVWGVRKDHCQDQINAIALLARLEMAGVRTGSRWGDVATHVAPHAADGLNGFLDLHYLYALARAGHDDAADQLAERLASQSDHDVPSLLARGLVAHARGDYRAAAIALAAARPDLLQVGGSNIQRALFADLHGHSMRQLGGRSRAPANSWKQAA